ncbi:MAG: anti-sigma factor family protein [Chloroflexota bacterium]
MTTPSFRDVEQLSAYLDGQLDQGDAARLETRLETDPQLASVFEALRQSRAILRQLPQRRAPRNFTLTPRMIGQNPPLPRAYPFFRLSTALAAVLLLFTFAINAIGPIPLGAMAPAPSYGMGGGAVEEPALAMEEPAATEAPAEPESPPAPEFAAPAATQTAPAAADSARAAEATLEAQAKQGASEPPSGMIQAEAGPEAMTVEPLREEPPPDPIPLSWQIALGILALVNASIVILMRRYAASQWRN